MSSSCAIWTAADAEYSRTSWRWACGWPSARSCSWLVAAVGVNGLATLRSATKVHIPDHPGRPASGLPGLAVRGDQRGLDRCYESRGNREGPVGSWALGAGLLRNTGTLNGPLTTDVHGHSGPTGSYKLRARGPSTRRQRMTKRKRPEHGGWQWQIRDRRILRSAPCSHFLTRNARSCWRLSLTDNRAGLGQRYQRGFASDRRD